MSVWSGLVLFYCRSQSKYNSQQSTGEYKMLEQSSVVRMEKSCICETLNLSSCADSSTDAIKKKMVKRGWQRLETVDSGRTHLKMAENNWKQFKLVKIGWKWLKMVENCWKPLKTDKNGWKRLIMTFFHTLQSYRADQGGI